MTNIENEVKFLADAIDKGELQGVKYWIINGPAMDYGMGGYNGYAYFPKRLTVEQGYDGILSYVPVHGGITYAEPVGTGMLYGFDTAHYDSDKFPRTDVSWTKEQISTMILGIIQASKVEKKYLTAKKNETRAKYAQTVLDVDTSEEQRSNFGINIKMLSGQL